MKLLNKLFALALVASLMITLAACGKKAEEPSKPEETSKPTVSTTTEDTTSTESNPEEDKTESKPESKPESTTESKPESKPEPAKKTPAELIIGKWKGKTNISTEMTDLGIDLTEPLEIDVYIEFTTSGTLIEKVDKTQMSNALRTVLRKALNDALTENGMTVQQFEAELGMTIDEYIDDQIELYQNSYTMTAEYRFESDVLFVKFEEDPEFTKTQYSFVNDNTLKIVTDSEEMLYTRI